MGVTLPNELGRVGLYVPSYFSKSQKNINLARASLSRLAKLYFLKALLYRLSTAIPNASSRSSLPVGFKLYLYS